jgi:hypothetical protein
VPTVERLWDPLDPLALLNVDRYNASIRYGVSLWLEGDADTQTKIRQHFGLTT